MDIELPMRTIPAEKTQAPQNRTNLVLVTENKQVEAPDNVKSTGSVVEGVKQTEEMEQNKNEILKQSVSQLNDLVQSVQRDLQFSIDEFSGDTVIKVLDTKTEEVIRQIPSEEVLALTENIESLKGVLFSAEV